MDTYSTAPKKPKLSSFMPAILLAGGLVIGGLGFAAGIEFQKGQPSVTAMASGMNPASAGFMSRRGGQRFGAIGTVSTVSATSITINNLRTGTDMTYTITSSTKILDSNSATVAVNTIQAGDRVAISPDTSDATTAAQITINPGFGRFQPNMTVPGSSAQ